MKPATSGVKITVDGAEEVPNKKEGVAKEQRFEFYNTRDSYLIIQEKEGYRSSVTPQIPRKFNKVKLIDFGLPLLCDLYLLGPAAGVLASPAYAVGTFGWLSPFYGPWHVYEKSYSLPALIPYPKRDSTERYLVVDQVSLNAPKDSLTTQYFESYRDFENGITLYNSNAKEKIQYDNLIFSESLNEILAKFGYADTLKKFLTNSFNSYNINCEISSLKQKTAGSIFSIELHAKWKILDAVNDKEVVGRFINASSNYSDYEVGRKDLIKNHIEDALEASLIKFLSDKEVKRHLNSIERSYANQKSEWDTLSLTTNGRFASGITAATKAVVTIKTNNGHGSGCVITPDGYIVTCYHVTGETKDSVDVITEAGKTLKAKVIRYNPLFDLALLKVDGETFEPLNLQLGNSFDLGTEVFAIGTPSDIELGQTLSKGIISGKRKVENKIYIQTDVSINKGNSGGALINSNGVLFGIVNAKIVGVGVEGIGFAIPVSYLQEALKIKILSTSKP